MNKAECIKYVEDHLEVRYATANGAYRSGREISPNGCVNHSVGCAQPSADVFFNLMNKESTGWGVSAILGDFHKGEGRILLVMPLTRRNWGCASGKNGSWNNTRVQWEVCEPAGHTYAGGTMIGYDVQKNAPYFERMWKMLVAWNVYCAVKLGYDERTINDHIESYYAGYGSGHADVGHWLPKHSKCMNTLREEVSAILNDKEDDDMDVSRFKELWLELRQELKDNDSSQYSEAARQWAVDNGLIVGGGNGADGQPNFMWEDVMTREQFVTVLFRFAQFMGKA